MTDNQKQLFIGLALFISMLIGMWIFLFTTYWLTCESHKVFDHVLSRMTFPYNCETSPDGIQWKNRNW